MKKASLKALVIVSLCLVMPLAICACAAHDSAPSGSAASPSPSVASGAGSSANAGTSSNSAAASSSSPKAVDVDWKMLSTTSTHMPDGYSIEVTAKMSPFISKDDRSTLEAVWGQVSNGKAFPDDSEFPYVSANNFANCDDIYYALGTVSIENATEGFDLPTDGSSWFNFDKFMPSQSARSATTHSSRLILADEGDLQIQNSDLLNVNVTMRGNSWGPVPVVFAVYDNKSLNYPNGCEIETVYLTLGDDSATLGLM